MDVGVGWWYGSPRPRELVVLFRLVWQEIVAKYDLKVVRVHTHIGSGSDPAVWQKVSGMSLDLCRQFDTVHTLNLGGGYKVGRMATEKSTDLSVVGVPVRTPAPRLTCSLTC